MKFDLSSLSKKSKLLIAGGGSIVLIGAIWFLFASKGPDIPAASPPASTAAEQLAAAEAKLSGSSGKVDSMPDAMAALVESQDSPFAATSDVPVAASAAASSSAAMPMASDSGPLADVGVSGVSSVGQEPLATVVSVGPPSNTPPRSAPAATSTPVAPVAPANGTGVQAASENAVPHVVAGSPRVAPAKPTADQDAGDIAGLKAKQIAANYDAYYTSLANLHRQTRVLALQKEIAELESSITELAVKGKERKASSNSVITSFPPPMRPSRSTDSTSIDSIFVPNSVPGSRQSPSASDGVRLVSTMMIGGSYEAVVSADGVRSPVKVGMTVDSGWVVADIDASEVTLKRKGKRKLLKIGG